jgi:hypothetical protein
MNGRSIKAAALAAVTGVSLAGGLIFGGALVSAEDETPTPAAEESATPSDATPVPDNGGSTTPDDGSTDDERDCPKDEGSGSSDSSSGTSFRDAV